MEVDDIFNEYEQGISRQEEVRRAEEARMIAQRAAAKEAIGKCLRDVIEPVLMDAKNKIIARGHQCSVEYQQRVEDVSGTRVEYAIGIYLETAGGKFIASSRTPKLSFTGDVKNHHLVVESDYGGTSVPTKQSPPVPPGSVTSSFVAQQVREFLAVVFRPPRTA